MQIRDYICKWSILLLQWDLFCLLDEGISQLGDLWSKMHSSGVPHPPISGLTHTLQGTGINQQPECVVPLFKAMREGEMDMLDNIWKWVRNNCSLSKLREEVGF